MLFSINVIFLYALIQYNKYLISTVDTDDLVLKHQGISSYSKHASIRFQLFMG